jgi:hypothetical protein
LAKKSWPEKLADAKPYEVKPAPIDIAGMKAGEIMLVPSSRLVDEFIRAIPRGASLTVASLRKALAIKHGAEVTCPITMGFHLRTIAEAAFEAHQRGASLDEITPFWRVLDEQAPTTRRLSFGPALIAEQRRREGLPWRDLASEKRSIKADRVRRDQS